MNSSSVATLKTGVWKRVTEMKICPKGTRLRMNCVGCSGRRAGGSQNVLGVEQRYPTFPSPTPSIRRSAMSLKLNQNKTLLPGSLCPTAIKVRAQYTLQTLAFTLNIPQRKLTTAGCFSCAYLPFKTCKLQL